MNFEKILFENGFANYLGSIPEKITYKCNALITDPNNSFILNSPSVIEIVKPDKVYIDRFVFRDREDLKLNLLRVVNYMVRSATKITLITENGKSLCEYNFTFKLPDGKYIIEKENGEFEIRLYGVLFQI